MKRGHDGTPCFAAARSQEEVVVDVENLPLEYTKDMIEEMLEVFGLWNEAFLRYGFGQQRNSAARCLEVVYSDLRSAQRVVQELNGQPVATAAGGQLELLCSVRPAGRRLPPMVPGAEATHYEERQAALELARQTRARVETPARLKPLLPQNDSARACVETPAPLPPQNNSTRARVETPAPLPQNDYIGVDRIYPSVYLSDVPLDWESEDISNLHQSVSLDTSVIRGVKFLPSKDKGGLTGCCIVRYEDDAAAHAAVEALNGYHVMLSNGSTKWLGARMAKPANWMMGERR